MVSPHFDPRSPFISSLSLCLLVRTNSLWLAIAVAFIAIASKFVIRRGGKHVFNPTNFAIVVMIVLSEGLWVSPGQWGSAMWVAFLVACLGIVVIHRSSRSDVTFALIGFYSLALVGRALWLGDPVSIPLHQLQSGAFLLFAFFMISDPKTTPDSRAGRILFAFLVTAGAVWVQFGLFRQNGFFYALTAASLVVPLIDRWLPGKRYEWSAGPGRPAPKGESNEVEHEVPNTGGLPVPHAAR